MNKFEKMWYELKKYIEEESEPYPSGIHPYFANTIKKEKAQEYLRKMEAIESQYCNVKGE